MMKISTSDQYTKSEYIALSIWVGLMGVGMMLLPYFYQQRILERWSRNDFWIIGLIGCCGGIFYLLKRKMTIRSTLVIFLFGWAWMGMQLYLGVHHDLNSYNVLFIYGSLVLMFVFLQEVYFLHAMLFGAIYLSFSWMVLLGVYQLVLYKGQPMAITGWMVNSGYYANYLVAILPMLITVIIKRRWRSMFFKWTMVWLVTMGVILVIFTMARAAIIGLIVAGMYIFKEYWIKDSKKKWFLFVGISIALFFMYFLKPASFTGRWMIYRVAAFLWWQHPWWGVGPGRFGAFFNTAQQQFIQTHSISPNYLQWVDDTTEAFNIIFQMAVEYGVGGLLLLAFLILLVYKHTRYLHYKSGGLTVMQSASLAGLIGIFTTSFFANPFHMPMVNVMAVFYLAHFFKDERSVIFEISMKRNWAYLLSIYMGALYFFFMRTQSMALHAWKLAAQSAVYKNFEVSQPYYAKALLLLRHDGAFLFNMGSEALWGNDTASALALLNHATDHVDATALYLNRGDLFLKKHNDPMAAADYLKSWQMVPSKLYPRYLLWKLYKKKGPIYQEVYWRNHILNHPPKIHNAWSQQWISEVKQFHQAIHKKKQTYDSTGYKTLSASGYSR